jgi:hypothetical protein
MLEGQAEGSMVGFKLDFRQETTLTLRVRLQPLSQHLDSPVPYGWGTLMFFLRAILARAAAGLVILLQARTQREAGMWIQALNGATDDDT